MNLHQCSCEKINLLAMEMLKKGNFSGAQTALEQNAKVHPQAQSLNNLGVFYIENGIFLESGEIQKGDKIGIKYLKRAFKQSKSPLISNNLAQAFFEKSKYKQSRRFWTKSLQIEPSNIVTYNLAVTHYYLREYSTVVHLISSNGSGLYEADKLLFFSAIHVDKEYALQLLDAFLPKKSDVDLLKALYFCGKYELVVERAAEVLKEWQLQTTEWAVLVDSFLRQKKKSTLIELVNDSIVGYNPEARKKIFRLMDDVMYRDRFISKCSFYPDCISMCGYYGCVEHKTEWSL